MSAEPKQLASARRCGAKTRGARGGRPCRSPAMPNGKCRLHGGKAGGPLGEKNGAYRHGRYTKKTKELGRLVRKMARAADVTTASLMQAVGMRPPRQLRRRSHVKKALAAAKAKGEKPT